MVFNATFTIFQLYRGGQFYWWRKPQYFSYIVAVSFIGGGNRSSNISVISWWSVLLVEETRVIFQLYRGGQFYWWRKPEDRFQLYRGGQFYWWRKPEYSFQLYRGGQFYWWRKLEYPMETINLSQVIDKLFSYIVEVSFIGGGNRRTRGKPPT